MILLVFMGFALFVCFIWSFVLLKRILFMNSDEVISMVSSVAYSSKHCCCASSLIDIIIILLFTQYILPILLSVAYSS